MLLISVLFLATAVEARPWGGGRQLDKVKENKSCVKACVKNTGITNMWNEYTKEFEYTKCVDMPSKGKTKTCCKKTCQQASMFCEDFLSNEACKKHKHTNFAACKKKSCRDNYMCVRAKECTKN